MRKTFTDYLDDVSTTYYLTQTGDPQFTPFDPDLAAHRYSDPSESHEPFMQRGDEGTFDWINYTGITVTYKIELRSRLKCNLEGW
jgi:hypothetical protein